MVPLTATGPEVFVATVTKFLCDSYDALEDILNHMKRLESAWASKPEHLGYITHIFEDTSDSRFRLWAIEKYKDVTEFIKKLRVCDIDVISQEDLITYESLINDGVHPNMSSTISLSGMYQK